MDTLCADTGVCGLTAKLELSLLAVRGSLSAGCRTLMTGVARDTHPIPKLAFCLKIPDDAEEGLGDGRREGNYLVV